MAKRARMTVDDVVQQCVDSDDNYAVCDYDPDEPVMLGSDDKFSDFEGDESDEDIDEGLDTMHIPAAQVIPALLGIKSRHGAPPSSG